jgi:hypothetical protein
MAIALADEEDIPLVLANDPDADRFCAAERVDGKWHIFSGNEMGIILAYHVYTRYKSHPNFQLSILPPFFYLPILYLKDISSNPPLVDPPNSQTNDSSTLHNAVIRSLLKNAPIHGPDRRLPPRRNTHRLQMDGQ